LYLFPLPPALYKGSCFSTSSPAFVVVALQYGHSNWGEMKSKCSFDFHLIYNQGCWIIFHVFTDYYYNVLREFCLIHWDIDCWGLIFWVLCRFWILVPYWMNRWQRYSPILGLSLVSRNCFFCYTGAL
jgi:hypothetical protein